MIWVEVFFWGGGEGVLLHHFGNGQLIGRPKTYRVVVTPNGGLAYQVQPFPKITTDNPLKRCHDRRIVRYRLCIYMLVFWKKNDPIFVVPSQVKGFRFSRHLKSHRFHQRVPSGCLYPLSYRIQAMRIYDLTRPTPPTP